MKNIIVSLNRIIKALDLLYSLQREEYELLLGRDKSGLQKNQFAIQKLLKQIHTEKKGLYNMLHGSLGIKDLNDIQRVIPSPVKQEVLSLINQVKVKEKLCMEQATQNADLAIAHLEQTKDLVNFLYDQIRPKAKNVYSRYGRLNQKTMGPCIINGRL